MRILQLFGRAAKPPEQLLDLCEALEPVTEVPFVGIFREIEVHDSENPFLDLEESDAVPGVVVGASEVEALRALELASRLSLDRHGYLRKDSDREEGDGKGEGGTIWILEGGLF